MKVEIEKETLVDIMWGLCLSDHLGDVWRSVEPLIEVLGISKDTWGDKLLDKMKEMDLIPDYARWKEMQWSWKMDYCKKKGIPPAEMWAWREAEKAYLKELSKLYKIYE